MAQSTIIEWLIVIDHFSGHFLMELKQDKPGSTKSIFNLVLQVTISPYFIVIVIVAIIIIIIIIINTTTTISRSAYSSNNSNNTSNRPITIFLLGRTCTAIEILPPV
jgi:uncharacterized alpha/beta hydrolase family protein